MFTASGTGAVTRTLDSKISETVSVTDFGADPTGAYDSTTAIQNAINECLNNLKKHLIFPIGTYRITRTITIPPYYAVGMPLNYWAPLGQDFHIDFGKAIILLDNPAGDVGFEIPAFDYPSTRYQFNMTGGVFVTTNNMSSVISVSGGAMWNIFFEGMSYWSGNCDAFFKINSDSPSFNFGIFSFRDLFIRNNILCAFVAFPGCIPQSDNFTFDNIYFIGMTDSSRMIDIPNDYLLSEARIQKCIHARGGGFISGGASGGYLVNCSLDGLYSETTTSGNAAVISANMVDCSVTNCRVYITSSLTQNIRLFDGQSVRSEFHNSQITAGNFSGGTPYETAPYLIVNFAPNSRNNIFSGYTPSQYRYGISGLTGAISSVLGVTTKDVLTSRNTWQQVSTVSYTKLGNSIPKASYIEASSDGGRVIELYAEGSSFGVNTKTFVLQFKIGANTLAIGGNITQSSGTWSASARILLTEVSAGTYGVYLYHGSAVNNSTLITNRLGNPDQGSITAADSAPIEFGIDITTITDGAVVIASASMSVIKNGLFDTEA